jgi:hypothetical protein
LASPVTARAQFRAMGVDDSELIEVDVAGNVTGLQTGHSIGHLNLGNIVNEKLAAAAATATAAAAAAAAAAADDDDVQLQGMGDDIRNDPPTYIANGREAIAEDVDHNGPMDEQNAGGNTLHASEKPRKRPWTDKERLERVKAKHSLLSLPASHQRCRKKCHDKFTEIERKNIHEHFWGMGYIARRAWLSRKVINCPRMPGNESRRKPNRMYFLNNSEALVGTRVCQSFFLRTLGYSSDRVIITQFEQTK